MPITIDLNDIQRMSDGSKWKMLGRLSFVGPYTTGGEELTADTIGLARLESLNIDGEEKGFLFEYDYVNQKLKVFAGSGGVTPSGTVSQPTFAGNFQSINNDHDFIVNFFGQGGVLVMKERPVVVAANVGNIGFFPAIVFMVEATVGASIGPKQMVGHLTAPAAGQVSVSYEVSTDLTKLTFNAADAVTAAIVNALRIDITSETSVSFTPTGTVSQPTFTGTPISGGAAVEIANGTNLSALSDIEFQAIGL